MKAALDHLVRGDGEEQTDGAMVERDVEDLYRALQWLRALKGWARQYGRCTGDYRAFTATFKVDSLRAAELVRLQPV